MNERYIKQQMSLVRWNVSDLVASKLAGKNDNSNCICWKVISFSWLEHGRGDMNTRNSLTQMSLDEWLCYKLIPARKEEAEDDLIISAPGLAVWRKWAFDHSGDLRCYFSVIKDIQPGNSEKKLVGVDAIIFPLSETLSWGIQKAELNNLVSSLPFGADIPLLIVCNSREENIADYSRTTVDELGLNNLDKSRISRFMVICLDEEGNAQFHGYFSDEKLKEGLIWLASESCSQPHLFCVTIRELVSHHLSLCWDPLHHLGKNVGPYQCISSFNQALDQSINDIISAANTNITGWPCPELFLMDKSTAEFRLVKQFLPTSGWNSSQEVGPLISSLRNCKLPSFPEDISSLNIACTSENIEDLKQLLQDSLIRYLTQSGNFLTSMMATKESHLMVQKYTTLELHGTVFKVVPSWVQIFRRVFNWHLNSSVSFSCKAYVLGQSLNTRSSPILDKLDPEVPESYYISQPSLDEMVEVSCSPIVSKRVRTSPKSFQNTIGITLPDFGLGERNEFSEIQVVDNLEDRNGFSGIQVVDNADIDSRKNDMALVPKDVKEGDRLSQLLDQCSILQDEIEKKLSIYF